MAKPVLSVRGLRKSFTLHTIDGRVVHSLRGVDLDVRAGEHVVLAGPSGAGKSSLLRCVNRTYLPDSGSVVLRTGEDQEIELTKLCDRAMAAVRGREFGYVSQFLTAPPRTGPLQLVAAAARRRGIDRAEATEAAADALRRLDLDPALWDVDCSVLSGGERQRVNLAAGTVRPPRLLMLDEPVSALDPANRERALEMIATLTAQGVAVLAVFHDREAMLRLASRVVLMRDGRIAQEGAPAEILEGVA
ncbi:ATP-binding cassette domain-containing protein [Mycobacterium sp. 1465703.0]|uniref:ATP-binding cassette domain-containing protein n=1 Tax=Mycobacterium sp. 1465703.0 TaxID=1834078 RepID=UPI000A491A82|nr:ATP-binding cassette domain-containing protein [Mycobacterium sp. 1465703.0]